MTQKVYSIQSQRDLCRAWVISVNMGYGHQRTAFSLKSLAPHQGWWGVINANDYQKIPEKDKKIWETTRKGYEFISNFYQVPLIGKALFSLYDQFQKILAFYPKRDLSEPNFTLKQIYSLLKKGWGKHFIEELRIKNKELGSNLPIISTFFTPAFMAEFFNYPGEIFCVVCDADISRTWASLNPQKSKIKYFAPTERVVERLKLYGVKPENIFLTGYPLPIENIGTEKLEILKEDLRHRLLKLDPQKKYFQKYKILIEANLGKLPEKSDHPLTIMFSVGGAGAQKEIATKIIKGLDKKIKSGQIKIILSAGIKEKVKEYFENNMGLDFGKVKPRSDLGKSCRCLSLSARFGGGQTSAKSGIEILFGRDIESYFQKFNQALRKIDILWTKPSELSFYSVLGIPIIIAPPIGSQEEFNKRWLLKSGFGILQEDMAHVDQWLFDWLERGYLAEAAMEGFIEGEKMGTYNIQTIISK